MINMSIEKYEFVPGDEKTIAPGRTVKRIRLLVAIAAFGLPSGSLGGYIESKECLSQSGNAWVSGDARVFGNAWVSGDARVFGDAQVSGDAQVFGDASIVWVSKVGRDNGTLTVFTGKDGDLIATRGCFIGTIDEFLAQSEKVHDDRTHLEYRMLIEVAHSRITRSAS